MYKRTKKASVPSYKKALLRISNANKDNIKNSMEIINDWKRPKSHKTIGAKKSVTNCMRLQTLQIYDVTIWSNHRTAGAYSTNKN